jgi:outer membrane lipoprotein SlyB
MSHRNKWAVLALTCLSFANGCSNMNNTQADALGGGALGAVAGAMIDRKHPGTGAAVGGVLGAATGAAVGSAADADERRVKAAQAVAASRPDPISLQQIVDMVHRGIGDQVICENIRSSGYGYNLSVDQINWLHDNGVNDHIISEMQRSRYYPPRPGYGYGPGPYDPVYVVPPPGPVVVGPTVGVGFGYYGHRW